MIRNNNSQVLRKIAFRSLKAGKMRNIFIIITVAMSAALISGLAGFCAGFKKEEERQLVENNIFVNNIGYTAAELITMIEFSVAILLVSILVIYSIFYISVTGRIRQFGQFRTIGMTSKQIGKSVNMEGMVLALAGILIGLMIGTIFAYLIKPKGFYFPNTAAIWLFTAAADLITVMLSIRKPAKIAAAASPVNAAKISSYEAHGKTVKHRKLTSFGLAKISVERNKKKFRMTVLSLGIAGILFLCGTTLLSSFNREEYSRQLDFYFGEYSIGISSNAEQLAEHGLADIQMDNPLNDALKENLASLDGVKKVSTSERLELSYEYNNYSGDDSARPFDREETELFSKYSEDGSRFDYDKMLMNKEVIVTDNDVAEEIFGWKFETGDQILLRWFDGTDYREDYFKIAGSIDTYALYHDRDARGNRLRMGYGWFLIPRELVENMVSDRCCLYDKFVVSVKDWQNETTVKKSMEEIAAEDSTLSLTTLAEEMERNESTYLSLQYLICGVSAFIIGFALINLINTLVSNVMSRKQEFAMLRSIGMRGRQLSQMIIGEGLILAVRNIIITFVFGTAAGYVLVYALQNLGAEYLHWHIPVWYLLGYVLLVIAAPVIISEIVIIILDQKTLVERLRENE